MGLREAYRRFPHAQRFDRQESVASAARTADGTSAELGVEHFDQIVGFLQVSAASGTTPTLDVYLQTTYDKGTTWVDIAASAQLTAAHASGVGTVIAAGAKGTVPDNPATSTDQTLAASTIKDWPLGDVCRWAWKIGGTTPSFTFTIDTTLRRD